MDTIVIDKPIVTGLIHRDIALTLVPDNKRR